MEADPRNNYKHRAENYLRNIDDTYIFDADTGIYKPKTIETDEQRARHQAGTNRRSRFFTDPRTDWWPVVIASLISLITVALLGATVYYARRQWAEMVRTANAAKASAKAAKQANKTTKEALVSVQRAFVFSTPAEMSPVGATSDNSGVDVTFRWENSGTTPTRELRTHISAEWRTEALPESFGFPDKWEKGQPHVYTHGTISPKGYVESISNIPRPITEQWILHRERIYFWGWAKYHDVFEGTPEHITKFCNEMVSVDQPPQIITQNRSFLTFRARFGSCPKNNCYDADCEQ